MNPHCVRVFGHRGGAAGTYPENSVAAFEQGLADGADALELDVRLSRDGRVMVIHDPMIDRVSTGAGKVAELGAAEIRCYGLRDGSGSVHEGVRIPVLEEVLEACPAAHYNIDLKTDEADLARAVSAILERYDAVSRTVIASFLPTALEFFRSIAPEIPTSAHPDEVRALIKGRYTREFPRTVATRVQVPARHGLVSLSSRGFVNYLHHHGLKIDIWTVNTARMVHRLVQHGVDGIVTDDVAMVRAEVGGLCDD